MQHRHAIIISWCTVCMVILAYIWYIYRPVSREQRQWIMSWHISYHLSRIGSDNEIYISGSWDNYRHDQIRSITDTTYNLQRTWYIEFFLTWWDIYAYIDRRDKDEKLWSSLSQSIDTIATTQKHIPITILPWKKIQWYTYVNNRPRVWVQRSHDDIHIDAYFYCHRRRWTMKTYTCSLDARISSPRWYRPLHGEIDSVETNLWENNDTIDFSQSLSIAELLHRVRQ